MVIRFLFVMACNAVRITVRMMLHDVKSCDGELYCNLALNSSCWLYCLFWEVLLCNLRRDVGSLLWSCFCQLCVWRHVAACSVWPWRQSMTMASLKWSSHPFELSFTDSFSVKFWLNHVINFSPSFRKRCCLITVYTCSVCWHPSALVLGWQLEDSGEVEIIFDLSL